MKSLRKVLSCALALTMAAGMFAVPAGANDEQATEEVTAAIEAVDAPENDAAPQDFEINDAGVLTKYKGVDEDVVIPSSVASKTITAIGENAFSGNKTMKSVSIPETVKSLGKKAFYECSSLKEIDIPASVESIGDFAFSGCTSLEAIDLKKGLKSIGYAAFGLNHMWEGTIQSPVVTDGCTSLKEIVIPSTVTYIGPFVFDGCRGLKLAVVQSHSSDDTIITLQGYTFAGCTSLEYLVLSDSITGFEGTTFNDCKAVKGIYYQGSESDWEKIKNIAAAPAGVKMYYNQKTTVAVSSIDVVTPPDKTKYEIGDSLALKGATFNATYSNGMVINFNVEKSMVTGFDSTVPGICTVTVKFHDVTGTFNVTIKGLEVVGIAVTTLPTKLEYEIGEELDVTGGVVTVTYDDTSKKEIPLTLDMCSGFDSSKAGTKTVTVTYDEVKTSFKVTVKKGGTPTPPTPTGAITLNGEAYPSYEAAIKSIGNKTGEFTLTIDGPIAVSKFTFPKNAKLEIIATENGSITTTAASLAPSTPLTIECPITNSKGKAIVINAKSDLTVTGGSFGNITVKGKAELTNVLVNGNVKLTAKADKFGFTTDTLTGVTATKGVSSNNNVIFADCPSLGTINVKGTVKITGEATKAVALTASSKTGISEVENLTVDKKVSIAGYLIASGLTSAGAVDVKGTATIADSTIAGKLSTKGALNVNGEVYCANAISCTQLTSTETAHLTYQSLAVTKYGIAANSADITVKVIDKRGSTVRFVAGDKKAVVVKSLKLPKGGTYNAVLILDEDCGTGTLTFEKNKVVLK